MPVQHRNGGNLVRLISIFCICALLCGSAVAATLLIPVAPSEYQTPVNPAAYYETPPSYAYVPASTPLATGYVAPSVPSYTGYTPVISGPTGLYTPTVPVVPSESLPSSGYSYTPTILPSSPGTGSGAFVVPTPSYTGQGTTIPPFVTPISSGALLLDNMFPRGLGELIIQNTRSDKDAVAILTRSGSLEPLIAVYISAGQNDTLKGIVDGDYTLYVTLGKNWDPVSKQFKTNVEYLRFSETLRYVTTTKTTSTKFEWSWKTYTTRIIAGSSEITNIGWSEFPKLAATTTSSGTISPPTTPTSPGSGTSIPTFVTPISNGALIIDNLFPRGLGELNIENVRTDKEAVVVLTGAGSIQPLFAVYVGKGQKTNVKGIPDGNYNLYYTVGQDWDPVQKQFKNAVEYRRFSQTVTWVTTTKTTSRQFEYSWKIVNMTIGYGGYESYSLSANQFPDL